MAELIGKTVIHLTVCFSGCILYHVLDAYFQITSKVFELLGLGFH